MTEPDAVQYYCATQVAVLNDTPDHQYNYAEVHTATIDRLHAEAFADDAERTARRAEHTARIAEAVARKAEAAAYQDTLPATDFYHFDIIEGMFRAMTHAEIYGDGHPYAYGEQTLIIVDGDFGDMFDLR